MKRLQTRIIRAKRLKRFSECQVDDSIPSQYCSLYGNEYFHDCFITADFDLSFTLATKLYAGDFYKL